MYRNQNVSRNCSYKQEFLGLDTHNVDMSSTKTWTRTRRTKRPMTILATLPGNPLPDDQSRPRLRSPMVLRQITMTHLCLVQLLLLLLRPVDALLNLKSQKNHPTTTTATPAASMGRLILLRAAPTSEEVRSRLFKELERLREKDRQTRLLRPMDLKVMYEDHDLVIVDKPSGVLCVPSEDGIPSLAQTVFETVNHSLSSYDRMVVHRLGMDTSGLVLFAKTMDALRGLNTMFRTRRVTREYEVLVCGHLTHTLEGTIDMPLMRDYEFPPYMRVSTEPHQRALLHLDAAIVGKKLLEAPKPSQTQFQVLKHEELKVPSSSSSSSLDNVKSLPVTRLKLTSITGRTHQLNVHCAAFGHPIVADRVYGFNGDAAPNGGLAVSDFQGSTKDKEDGSDGYPAGILARSVDAASLELQQLIAEAAANMPMCVHAKRLRFQHPVTNEEISISSPTVF